jgi:hypothetical protein
MPFRAPQKLSAGPVQYVLSSISSAAASRLIKSLCQPLNVVALSGIGAYATATPSATPGAPVLASLSGQTPSSTANANGAISVRSSSSHSNAGVIAGAVVGSCIAVTIIGVLAFLLHRANRKLQQKQYIDNASVNGIPDQPRPFSDDQNHSAYETVPLPHRSASHTTLRPLPIPPGQTSPLSTPPLPPEPRLAQADIRAIAREVAELMRSNDANSSVCLTPLTPNRPTIKTNV